MPKKLSGSYRHLNQADRDRMEALLDCETKQKEIGKILGVDPSTISRERKRQRKNGHYDAAVAGRKAWVRRLGSKYQGMKVESNLGLKEYIIRGLRQKRSPDEIAGRMKREKQPFYASNKRTL